MIAEPAHLPERQTAAFPAEHPPEIAASWPQAVIDAMFENDANHPTATLRSVPCPTFS
jgi:hypothetical protein